MRAIVELPVNRASGFRESERAVIIGMRVSRSRRRWLILTAAIGIFFIVAVGAAIFLNPWITHYIESDAFREAMERETARSEEHTSELQSRRDLVCRLLLEKKN